MRTILTVVSALIPEATLAHEAENMAAATSLAEADWQGPILALLVILVAAVLARSIRRKAFAKLSPPSP